MSDEVARTGPAHRGREAANASAAERSLEAWALEVAPVQKGQAVLDLGCGTGKLALPYAVAVGAGGLVLAIDKEADSVAELRVRARGAGLLHVSSREGWLDTVVGELEGENFDLVVSSYAIYYAADPPGLMRSLRARLAEGGRLFVCGPGEGTNREMDELVGRVAPRAEDLPPPVEDFLAPGQIDDVASAYGGRVRVRRFANVVRFTSAEALLTWWRNHSMYVAGADGAVERAVASHFAASDTFGLTKNVLGLVFSAT